VLEEFFGYDIPHAVWGTAETGVIPVVLKVEPIIESELFSSQEVAGCHDPNSTLFEQRFAVRSATVVDKPRWIPRYVPIDVPLLVQAENIFVVAFTTPQRLLFGNHLPDILDHTRAFRYPGLRKCSNPVNGRASKEHVICGEE
jgi:hypothetical protein